MKGHGIEACWELKILTYHGLNLALHELQEPLVDPHSQVTEDLTVLREIKVAQAVFVLLGCVLTLEGLERGE